MKVYIQVVDTKTGIYQCGMIEEPVKKSLEIQNALSHFGVDYAFVDWKNNDFDNRIITKVGTVEGTTKVVSVIGFE